MGAALLTFDLQTMSRISLDFGTAASDSGIMDSATGLALDTDHSSQSSTREKVLEHLFVGDLLRCLWRKKMRDVEVLRAEVDRGGYDVVVEYAKILRHIQLKSSYDKARTQEVGINTNLAGKPSGCIVWIQFDAETMQLGPFLWFGGPPGAPLPDLGDRIGRHTKSNSAGIKGPRPGIRRLRRNQFKVLPTMDALIEELFGSGSVKGA